MMQSIGDFQDGDGDYEIVLKWDPYRLQRTVPVRILQVTHTLTHMKLILITALQVTETVIYISGVLTWAKMLHAGSTLYAVLGV